LPKKTCTVAWLTKFEPLKVKVTASPCPAAPLAGRDDQIVGQLVVVVVVRVSVVDVVVQVTV